MRGVMCKGIMCEIDTEVILKTDGNIPVEIIMSSISWQDALLNNLPFVITVVIVLAAATVTYRSNRKSVESQNDISSKNRQEEHERKISEFRHQWLQEVRETASELVQIIHDCQYLTKLNNSAHERAKSNSTENNKNILEENLETMKTSFERLILKRSEFYKKEAKLRLLFKKDDKETIKMFKIIDSIKERIGSDSAVSLDDESIINVVTELQKVLKTEWEVTKNRDWLKNT